MPASTIQTLLEKGVLLTAPETIEIDQPLNPDRVSGNDVTIHAGCRLFGGNTLICDGAELGLEAPVTVNNCYIGPNVKLKGRLFRKCRLSGGRRSRFRSPCTGGHHLRRTGQYRPYRGVEADHPVSLCDPGQPDQFL